MKYALFPVAAWCATALIAAAAVKIDEEAFGKSLGGWTKHDKHVAEYSLSGATYRTYKPEISPTPDGGIFISVRIDHVRSWLSSDDHAMLEVTLNAQGVIVAARSDIALQGRSISSNVILASKTVGKTSIGSELALQIGSDLVADLSSKLLRENIVEAGRVSFPAAVRHNYNLLFQAIRQEAAPEIPVASPAPDPITDRPPVMPAKEATPAKPAKEATTHDPLEIKTSAAAHP
ncbi:MAG: hypothetical protein WCJ14_00565 [Verrucomicrobiota bacterium]